MSRISVEPDDPAFLAVDDLRRHLTHVFLNGEQQSFCLTADEEEGFVKRIVSDAQGKPVLEGSDFKTEVVRGSVRISWPDDPVG